MEGVEFADIHQAEIILHQADDAGTMAGGEIEVDDAEAVGETIHEREQAGRE